MARDGSGGPLRSYTRPAGETIWMRWPGEDFDPGYGLVSPFSVLRLYPLADEKASGEADQLEGMTDKVTKTQSVFSADTVQRLLRGGVFAVAADPEERGALEAQLIALLVPQTVTYWVGANARVYQAAATLLTADSDGQSAPWLEVVWRFWGMMIRLSRSSHRRRTLMPATRSRPISPLRRLHPKSHWTPAPTCGYAVFALPGVPAERVKVTVYPAGKKKALGSTDAQDAQFVLPTGTYDVQVESGGAEEWLKSLVMVEGNVISQDVVFDFGTLALTVVQNGVTPQVDIVIYPAGQRQTWADYRAENPTSAQLRAGKYDIEVALPDFTGSKVIEGVEVRSGETVSQTIRLDE